MSASAITPATRFFRPGKTKVVITPTVDDANGNATRTEINAGLDVSGDVQGVAGFTQSAAKIDTPDWGSRVTSSINGRITLADSSITLYADEDGADIRDELDIDQETCVIFMDNGDTPALPMDVFKCVVNSIAPSRDGEGAAVVVVSFTIRSVHERKAIPA